MPLPREASGTMLPIGTDAGHVFYIVSHHSHPRRMAEVRCLQQLLQTIGTDRPLDGLLAKGRISTKRNTQKHSKYLYKQEYSHNTASRHDTHRNDDSNNHTKTSST